MSGLFMNAPEDCQWLRETHLKGIMYPTFKSFILHGNEDSPEKLELYAYTEPELTDTPWVTLLT